ncbi:uncharacterized protein B0H18DRAFT_1122874 [Fomitopsis serialis]|uniref:uncharacterized protein n=1 Tax=Fomitopsis serialis TaxID=139415 RepID=UPI002007E26F|nr:uncharacterized protein B0H18DRAFT_1122874 [Neoantrodia serialis]KAH9918798.1 hypothetical protein B0H18DRAFT_1122874 [Neoantrodia serialis]
MDWTFNTKKNQFIEDLKDTRNSRKRGVQLSARSRLLDFNATVNLIICLFKGLKARVGVEGFFCLVRSSTKYNVSPHLWFSSAQLGKYLRLNIKGFDLEKIGLLAEAFVVAGCDWMTFLHTSKDQANFLKTDIRDMVHTALVNITGNPKIIMNYKSFEHEIVIKYGIDIEGWTPGKDRFINPSDLSDSLPLLRTLHEALESGTCKFIRLSAEQVSARRKAYDARVNAGEVVTRKTRKDKGGSHKKPPKRKGRKKGKHRSDQPSDDDSNSSEDSDEDDEGVPRPRKRRRVVQAGGAGEGQ